MPVKVLIAFRPKDVPDLCVGCGLLLLHVRTKGNRLIPIQIAAHYAHQKFDRRRLLPLEQGSKLRRALWTEVKTGLQVGVDQLLDPSFHPLELLFFHHFAHGWILQRIGCRRRGAVRGRRSIGRHGCAERARFLVSRFIARLAQLAFEGGRTISFSLGRGFPGQKVLLELCHSRMFILPVFFLAVGKRRASQDKDEKPKDNRSFHIGAVF
jgi:hypothetical protein